MEHAQREHVDTAIQDSHGGLNPYFNGTCSKRKQDAQLSSKMNGLNPYFNGTCSKSQRIIKCCWFLPVLILILMEHAQRGNTISTKDDTVNICVLILILMEHAQRDIRELLLLFSSLSCLNPYFNGTCSKSFLLNLESRSRSRVLILILMEHAQRVSVLQMP